MVNGPFSNRSEFITDDTIDGLRYSRNGGCFVTTKKAVAFVFLALASLAGVIVFMYYYSRNNNIGLMNNSTNNIEELLNETINKQTPEEDLRLPKDLYPIHYKLKLHPKLDEPENNFTFTGSILITINCSSSTDKIVLNWDDELTIFDSQIKIAHVIQRTNVIETAKESDEGVPSQRSLDSNETMEENHEETTTESITEKVIIVTELVPLTIKQITRDKENFKFVILLDEDLIVAETYSVNIKFSGNITNNLVGFYRTSFVDKAGNIRWVASTQFTSVYARTVFPCFDEPSFKAPFQISIARRANMTALSNMDIFETVTMNETGWVWDHFKTSPPISTYLLAFAINDFDRLETNISTGTAIRIWAPKDVLEKTQYALDVSQEILQFFENYFGIRYPLPKLDLVVIPSLSMDSMENWGMIFFRKSILLLDPLSRSFKTKSLIFTKIAHEIVHQWFGSLVSIGWWSDLWLNEGFGTFMTEVALEHLRPRWQVYSSIQLRNPYKTLYYDSLKSTHSIEVKIKNNAEIENILDVIVTSKGSSILRMLNYTLTSEIFQRTLRNYLKKFSFQSTSQDDLWGLFTKKARNQSIIPENVTIKAMMNSWTTQDGYPLVTITRNYSTGLTKINQTQMMEDLNTTSSNLWYIPLTYVTKQNKEIESIWLEKVSKIELDIEELHDNDSWILANVEETGFLRVNYDLHNWRLLSQQLQRNPNRIPLLNRGHLIDDAFQLANIGLINYTVAFELVKYLTNSEINYIPWYAAMKNLEELRIIISNYEYSGLYEKFILSLITPAFEELGTSERSDDTQNEKQFRLLILMAACQLRYSKCTQWAREQYEKWMKSTNPDEENFINVDYKYTVLCSAIRSGGPEEWNFLWNRTLSPSILPSDLDVFYTALGCTYDPLIINRYLEYSLSGNMTLENVQNVWKSINHPVGVRTGFQFLRLNWERIFNTYEDNYPIFETIFEDFVSELSTEIDLEDLTTFYKIHQHDLKSVANILQTSVDQIMVRIKWKQKHLESVMTWIKKNTH